MSMIASDMKGRVHAQQRTQPWASVSAALLGLVILYGVGFTPLAAHNAAHDARHAAAFPCH